MKGRSTLTRSRLQRWCREEKSGVKSPRETLFHGRAEGRIGAAITSFKNNPSRAFSFLRWAFLNVFSLQPACRRVETPPPKAQVYLSLFVWTVNQFTCCPEAKVQPGSKPQRKEAPLSVNNPNEMSVKEKGVRARGFPHSPFTQIIQSRCRGCTITSTQTLQSVRISRCLYTEGAKTYLYTICIHSILKKRKSYTQIKSPSFEFSYSFIQFSYSFFFPF